MEHETFFSLLGNAAHWEFEIFLMFVFDVLIGMVLRQCFKRWTRHHTSDDAKIDALEQEVKKLKKQLGLGD